MKCAIHSFLMLFCFSVMGFVPQAEAASSPFKKVMTVIFENQDYSVASIKEQSAIALTRMQFIFYNRFQNNLLWWKNSEYS